MARPLPKNERARFAKYHPIRQRTEAEAAGQAGEQPRWQRPIASATWRAGEGSGAHEQRQDARADEDPDDLRFRTWR